MNIRISIVMTAVLLAGLSVRAAVRNEWTFELDAGGTPLSRCINSGTDGSAFEEGGLGVLEADGTGALQSTPDNPSLWTGTELDADLTAASSLFMRYDLEYDLTGTNDIGTSIGIGFVDGTGYHLTGLTFVYEPDDNRSSPPNTTVTPVIDSLPLSGRLSAIAEVSTSDISVWYSTNGTDFVIGASGIPVSITSINQLRIQATGQASGETNAYVAVENIRIAETWDEIVAPIETILVPTELSLVVASGETASKTFTLVNFRNTGISYSISDDAPWIRYEVETIGDAVKTTAVHQVTYSPESGVLPANSAQDITIHADADGRDPGTTTFTTTIAWGNGAASDIDVTVIVEEADPKLSVSPASISFEGPAGMIAQTEMVAANVGNATLSYRIANFGALTNKYAWIHSAYDWKTIQRQDNPDCTFAPGTDSGTTPWISMGFPFLFNGTMYSEISISVDGEIFLGDEQIIGPCRGDLVFDGNSNIRCSGDANLMVVTWENLGQKSGADDLTFQAVLHRSGVIVFQYALLSNASRWPDMDISLEDTGYKSSASLVRESTGPEDPGTATFTTNYVVVTNGWNGDVPITSVTDTNVVITYHDTVRNEALLFYPAEPVVITCDPVYGLLRPGESHNITVFGDASALTPGEVNGAEARTAFSFTTQPPILIDLVEEDPDEYVWAQTQLDGQKVFGVFHLRRTTGDEAPFDKKPIAVYVDGVAIPDEPFAPELGSDFLNLGNKWSWGPNNAGQWDTVHIRLPWRGSEQLQNPDNRAADPIGLTLQAEPAVFVEVSFTATAGADPAYALMDTDEDGMADLLEWTAGTDANDASSFFAADIRQTPDGARTLSWPVPNDPLSRTYVVWYTTDLDAPWQQAARLENITSYTDTDPVRIAEPVIFYRISVE